MKTHRRIAVLLRASRWQLWAAADKTRHHVDSAEYKHVGPGLILFKYISDVFDMRYTLLKNKKAELKYREECAADNISCVPKEALWSFFRKNAKQFTFGKLIDGAMVAVGKEKPLSSRLRLNHEKIFGGRRN